MCKLMYYCIGTFDDFERLYRDQIDFTSRPRGEDVKDGQLEELKAQGHQIDTRLNRFEKISRMFLEHAQTSSPHAAAKSVFGITDETTSEHAQRWKIAALGLIDIRFALGFDPEGFWDKK